MALDFFAGCVGGAAGVIVGHPLDTVKVRIQTQSPDNIKYRGTFHTLSQIVKQESASGLYKGITSPLVGVAGINAIVFGVYGMLRPYVAGHPGNDALWAHFAAGAASGSVQSVVCAPMELVKIRMQTNESGSRESSMDVLKKIYRSEGGLFRGVYKGWMITLMREVPGFGSYFTTYELLTTKTGYQVGTMGMLFAGGMAGVVSWMLTFPIDVVKTRLQMSEKRLGIVECANQILKAEGWKAFFRGMNSSVIRAFPTNAATFTVVNWIIRLTSPQQDDLHGNEREGLAHILKEWDLSKVRPKEIFDIMKQWGRLPDYNYLSSKYLFPHSSVAQPSNAPAFNIMANFNSLLSSRSSTSSSENEIPVEKLPTETIQYKTTDYEIYEPETSEKTCFADAEQSKTPAKISQSYSGTQSLTSSYENRNWDHMNNLRTRREAEAPAVPQHTEQSSGKAFSSSFLCRLTDWLSNFTLTPVHFCKCVDNCSCRD